MRKNSLIKTLLLAFFMGVSALAVASHAQDPSATDFGNFVEGAPPPLIPADTLQDVQNTKRIESFKLIKRNIDYQEQMTIAVSMMAFIALMFFSSQTLNPG